MNREIAEHVASVAFKNAAELTRLIPLLKHHLSPEEYEPYRKSLTRVGAIVADEVLFKIFKEHPEIDAKIKATLEVFGKLP